MDKMENYKRDEKEYMVYMRNVTFQKVYATQKYTDIQNK